MKILLSALVLSSFGAYASEISQQDFVKVIKANEAALSKICGLIKRQFCVD